MPSSGGQTCALDRKSTRLNSSHTLISYAVFCLKKEYSKSEEHTSELQSHSHLVCRLLLEEKPQVDHHVGVPEEILQALLLHPAVHLDRQLRVFLNDPAAAESFPLAFHDPLRI